MKLPIESSFKTYISSSPKLVRLDVPDPGSKSTVPVKYPVEYTYPPNPVEIELPVSFVVLPTLLAHKKFPDELTLAIKISLLPLEVKL